MFKKYLLLLPALLVFNLANAQTDTLLYYLNNTGQVVDKAQADHYTVIAPPNANSVLYPVYEFYMNGKRKLVATSYTGSVEYLLHGTAMQYFPNGKRKAIITYKLGAPVTEVNYYPNGQVYSSVNYDNGSKIYKECRDSTGAVLTENGNGKWLTYDGDLKQLLGGGQVTNGKPEGEWHEILGDSIKSTIVYRKGVIKSGVSYDKAGKAYTFKQALVKPGSKLLNVTVFNALAVHRKSHPNQPIDVSKPILTFWVDPNGKVSDIQTINNIPVLTDLITKTVTQTTWQPGLQNGVPVGMRTSYPSASDLDALTSQREYRSITVAVPAGSVMPDVGDKIDQRKPTIIK